MTQGAAVDAREDITGRTALHIAAHEGRETAIEAVCILPLFCVIGGSVAHSTRFRGTGYHSFHD
eukprot:3197237-Rhodomonas_salina.3